VNRSGRRHLVDGVIAAVWDAAGKGGRQGMLVFFQVDELGGVAIEGNGENNLGIGASAPDGENGIGVHVEVVVVVVMVEGRKDIGKGSSWFNDFFNESQSCRGKSKVEILLTLEEFRLLLSCNGCL